MNQINNSSAYELIETNKHKQIDNITRRAIIELYGVNQTIMDGVESDVILKTRYCRVLDVVNQLHSIGYHPKARPTVEPVVTYNPFGYNESTVASAPEPVVVSTGIQSAIDESIEHTEDTVQANEMLFKTTQNNVVIATKELIKQKNTDFRVFSAISLLSNVDNNIQSGSNTRYTSVRKVDKNMDTMCKAIGISPSQFKKHLRALLKHNTDEFKLVEREYNGNKVMCYEINYSAGGFVLIPVEKVEKLLIGLSNNCIKLYANLLWLCTKDGKFIERELTQPYLLELMGLSKTSDKILKIATETLVECNLIQTRKVWESETIIKDGMPVGSKPISKIYYSIVI